MNKWLGFFVGLAIAITVVLTVVRPATAPQESPRDHQGMDVEQELVLPPPARRDGSSTAESSIADEPRVKAEENEPATEPQFEHTSPPGGETIAAGVAAEVPEPVAEPIPEFRWDAAPKPGDQTEIVALPEPQVRLLSEPPVAPSRESTPDAVGATSVVPGGATSDSVTLSDADAPGTPTARQWYAFWQPFGSEMSARGFSSRLERVTGLDYRVVKVAAGEYHVAFGYDDEASRLANLGAIEAATGLSIGGQSL